MSFGSSDVFNPGEVRLFSMSSSAYQAQTPVRLVREAREDGVKVWYFADIVTGEVSKQGYSKAFFSRRVLNEMEVVAYLSREDHW